MAKIIAFYCNPKIADALVNYGGGYSNHMEYMIDNKNSEISKVSCGITGFPIFDKVQGKSYKLTKYGWPASTLKVEIDD